MSAIGMTEIINHFKQHSTIVKKKSLTDEEIAKLILEYLNSVNSILLEYGQVQVSDDFKIELVKLQKRKHVLRGREYTNWRKYKVKSTVSWKFYENIEKAFEELEEAL